jgi:DNA-binding transcriptional MerR regulator
MLVISNDFHACARSDSDRLRPTSEASPERPSSFLEEHRISDKPLSNLKHSLDLVACYRDHGGAVKVDPPSHWTRASLAKLAGIGPETLRYYEQKGLLEEPLRNPSGYRIYRDADLERLQFIRRSQDLGFSLQDIRQILDLTGNLKTPRKKVRDFAAARLTLIREKITHLRAMENALGSLVARCDGKGALKGCPIAEFIGGSPLNPHQDSCHE